MTAASCRLGKQASLFYEEVQRCLFAPPLAAHFDKSWTAHCSVKAAVYDTEAQLQGAADLHSKDEIALEICRLQVCGAACWAGAGLAWVGTDVDVDVDVEAFVLAGGGGWLWAWDGQALCSPAVVL